MNKFKYFILLLAGIAIVSCNKDHDDPETVPLRDYAEQFKADNDSIVKYLKTNYIKEVTPNFDIVLDSIPKGGTQVSIWDQKDYPLQTRKVYNDDITYTVYYLTLRKGTGLAPTNTDQIYATYVGTFLDNSIFDQSYGNPASWNLFVYEQGQNARTTIEGWAEIFPQFRTGTSTTNAGTGEIKYDNFGAGVMFLPSGLAYYSGSDNIPMYTPLIFSFKLMDLARLDHDGDGIKDVDEDVNNDGYLYNSADKIKYPNFPDKLLDDTDKDGTPDFLDVDDDGDGWSTFKEITKPEGAPYSGISTYYPFNPVSDNPITPNIDEKEIWGIPRKFTGPLVDPTKPESATNPKTGTEADYTDPNRLRIHLDKTVHTATGY